jgi:hypothetical protein
MHPSKALHCDVIWETIFILMSSLCCNVMWETIFILMWDICLRGSIQPTKRFHTNEMFVEKEKNDNCIRGSKSEISALEIGEDLLVEIGEDLHQAEMISTARM